MIDLIASIAINSNPLAVSSSTSIAYPFDSEAQISSPFSESRKHPIFGYNSPHRAVDLVKPCGTPIKASINGRVTVAGSYGVALGNAVVVQNETQKVLVGHVSKVLVKVGQDVRIGDIIALVGSEGYSTGCHVHLDYRIKIDLSQWKQVNPVIYFEPKDLANGD